MTATARRSAIAWLMLFGVLLLVGSGLLGELSGSFGDSDSQFDAIHGTQSNRLRFVAGGGLLVLGALTALTALPAVATILARVPVRLWGVPEVCALSFALVFAALMAASGSAYATVSASREFASLFDDRGQFGTGAWVLPQLGTVLFIGAGAAASALVIAMSATVAATGRRRLALRIGGGVVALLLLVSFAGPPLVALLPVWLGAVVLTSGAYDESSA